MESDLVQHQIEEIEQSKLLQQMVIDTIGKQPCRRVKDIVSTLQHLDKSLTLEEIHDAIDQLKNDNKVMLVERQASMSFFNHVVDLHANTSFWLTIFVTALTLATIYLTPRVEPWSIIRIVAGGFFILFIPGYSLLQVLFLKKDMHSTEHVAISIGLSLAIVPLVGLLLNYSPWGIRLDAIVASLSTASIVLVFCGAYARFSSRQKL